MKDLYKDFEKKLLIEVEQADERIQKMILDSKTAVKIKGVTK